MNEAAAAQQAKRPPPKNDGQNDGRRRSWLHLAPLFLFGLLALLFMFRLFAGDASRVPSALIGKPAPALTLAPLEGLVRDSQPVPGIAPASLAGGKVTVLNIFASWCAPCRAEHPFLVEMANVGAVRAGQVQILGLNYKDEPENARRFLGALGNPFSAVGTDRAGRASIELGVYGVPETFLISKDGVILKKHIGPLTEASARALMADAAAAAR